MKKKGFTLAETMITLFIIGILSLLLIPVINNQKINRNKLMIKKAHKVVEEVTAKIINDRELYRTNDFENVLADTTEGTLNGEVLEGDNKFTEAFKRIVNIDNRPESRDNLPPDFDFLTTDGIAWRFSKLGRINFVDGSFLSFILLNVDINGNDPPNSFGLNTESPDRLGFRITADGTISSFGDADTDRLIDNVYGSNIWK